MAREIVERFRWMFRNQGRFLQERQLAVEVARRLVEGFETPEAAWEHYRAVSGPIVGVTPEGFGFMKADVRWAMRVLEQVNE